jgi:8-oxo-dGTP pyrophosphatase MutT (NUDIX family)/uncharacterized protein YndB with AHSA1/START domain
MLQSNLSTCYDPTELAADETMKLKFETVIDASPETVWAAFDNRDNMARWQQNLQSFNHVSGEPGQPGAVSELRYDEKGKEVILTETITERREPDFLAGTYDSPMGKTLIVNHFETVDENSTRWTSWCNFTFKGFMKVMSLFVSGMIRKRTEADMERFRIMSWKKLGSKTVYDNPWITVVEDRVVNPGGGQNDYGVVHFKNVAVAIVPLDGNGNTWLVGQERYALGAYSWELPMGGAPGDEEPLAAAKRELQEETGLTAKRWSQLMRLHTSNSVTDEEGIVFVAEDLEEGEPDFDEVEDLQIRKLPFADAVAMVERGEITDAISVAALLYVNNT